MILVAHFQISGFFDWIAVHVAAIARTRFQLLVLLVFATGILAAFFVNDTICLIFTPIVLVVTQRLEVPPIPYCIAVATSANIGSAMSVTGNPQNAVIGVSAHFSFLGFLAHLAPVSLVGMVINVAVLSLFFHREIFHHPLKGNAPELPVKMERTLLIKCCIAAALVIVLWILGYSFPLVAISVGAFILIIGRVKAQNIYQRLDWELLLFFASLFVVIKGFEASGALEHLIGYFQTGLQGGMTSQLFAVSGVMLILSNLVSNLPAVLLFRSAGAVVSEHALHLAGSGLHQHARGERNAIQFRGEFDCAAAGGKESENYVLGICARGINRDADHDAGGDCDSCGGASVVARNLKQGGKNLQGRMCDPPLQTETRWRTEFTSWHGRNFLPLAPS